MVSFKMFAGTNIGLRENNEDNFTVCPDILNSDWIVPENQERPIPLGQYGSIMVVADGMGGQNAGEVASAIAIETVQIMFSKPSFKPSICSTDDSIEKYLKQVISEADCRVKKYAATNRDAEGMGTTMVLTWIIGDMMYAAWIGDSRIYSYIPEKGLIRISKDHSYVQKLVDEGVLTDEEAMYHPNSNVITKSIGDTSQKAKADVAKHYISEGEIIMLCTDGLCGVCTDDLMCSIIGSEKNSLQECKESLTQAALDAGGSDNITIALIKIVSASKKSSVSKSEMKYVKSSNILNISAFLFGVILIFCLIFASLYLFKCSDSQTPNIKLEIKNDTLVAKEGNKVKFTLYGNINYDNLLFQFDTSLLKLNEADSTFSLINVSKLTQNTTLIIKVLDKNDTTIFSSEDLKIILPVKKLKVIKEDFSLDTIPKNIKINDVSKKIIVNPVTVKLPSQQIESDNSLEITVSDQSNGEIKKIKTTN